MKYLLDTHVLIWYAMGDKRLPEHIRSIILDVENEMWVSAASIWEMTIKSSLGKLEVHFTLPEWEAILQENYFDLLPNSFLHFEVLRNLPFFHNDPFDRLILAQAIAENCTLITHDRQFQLYPVNLEFF